MILGTFLKQPREIKDYNVDFNPWLKANEDKLYEVYVLRIDCIDDPEDEELKCFSVLHTLYEAKFWMIGGTPGYAYKLTLHADTEKGRRDESEIIFAIEDI